MDRALLAANLNTCRSRLREASARWGEVTICAVTKTRDAETINMAYDEGVRIIGENRVQEAREKFPALNPDFCLHIIGQLQTNKVKYLVGMARMVQSLDRMPLAREIDLRAGRAGVRMPVLVQVNIAAESQKAGIPEAELVPFLREIARLPGLSVEGLMAIMPLTPDQEALRPLFRRMRTWFDRLREEAVENVNMRVLSMGMSGDYTTAAEEGATMVRLGSAIFGARPAPASLKV
jgi:pyridoxal phosphate enzyme (YggS family)